MKNFIRRCVAATIISQLAISVFAQSWNLVWREDFGVAEDTVIKDFPNASMTVPRHSFAGYKSEPHYGSMGAIEYHEKGEWQGECGIIDDGQYGIANSTWWAYNRFDKCNQSAGHFIAGRDHTGNKNGAMLIVNSEVGTGLPIYTQKIEFDLCDSREYKFVIYAASITAYQDDGGNANLEMKVINTKTNQEIENIKTEDIPFWKFGGWGSPNPSDCTTCDRNWSEYACTFTANDGDVLELQVVNWGSGYNDFVIDDISLYRNDNEEIPDPIISATSVSQSSSSNDCSYLAKFSVPNQVLTDWKKIYDQVYFLWQQSTDDGITWQNVSSVSGIDKTDVEIEMDKSKNTIFRVIITGGSTPALAEEQALYIAEHGGPKGGCAYYSISNTLAAKPVADCTYSDDLEALFVDDFGSVADNGSTESPYVVLDYLDKGLTAGNYSVTANPINTQKNSWDGIPSYKDHTGNDDGGMIFCKLNENVTTIYERTVSGPFCKCKSYLLSFYATAIGDWSTLKMKAVVEDERGNVLASLPISEGNGGKEAVWKHFVLDFSPEDEVNNFVVKLISNDTENNEYGTNVVIDDISLRICGIHIPQKSLYIDNDENLRSLSGFDCNDETPHTVDFAGIADWKDQYPNAAFIWQSSVDGGDTWDNLSATTTSIAYEGEPEILYRVVIGESSAVAEEVARNGKPADGCSIFFITNEVGFKCKESGCRAPKFSLDADDEVVTLDTVFCDTPDAIDIELFQTNRVNVDDFYIAKMGTDNNYGTATVLSPTPTSTNGKWTISLDKKSAKYMIYAMNDTCKSDTVYINVDIREKIELNPIEDQLFCANQIPSIKVELKSGKATSVYLKSGSLLGTANIILGETEVPFTEDAKTIGEKEFTVYAVDADEKCKSEEIIFKMDYEDIPVFAFSSDVLKVCKGEKAELKLEVTPNHNSENHIYEIKDDKNNIINIEDLVVFPTEDVKYTATASSEICPTKVTSAPVGITVELPQAIDLSTVPSPALQTSVDGNIICAPANVSFTVSGDNLTTWDWEYRKKGESDFSKWEAGSTSISNSIEITEETSFRVSSAVVSSNVCDKAYSEIITIQTEKKPEFTLALDKDRVCETGTVELSIVTTETYATSQITATANGSPISLVNGKYSATISEKTKFDVIVAGEVCEQTSFDTTAYVDHPLSFTMTPNKTSICEGDDVTFTVTGASDGIVWYKSTDNRNYTEFTPTTDNKITPDQTIYVYAGTPSDGACEAFKVEPVKIEVEKALSFDLVSDVTGKICAGTPVNLSVKNLVGTPKTSKWEKNGIEVTAVSSLNDSPVSSSTYKVTLNGDVCPSVDHEVNIEVESADALSLVADKTLICEGESVTLTKDYGTNDPNIVTWWAEVDGIRTKITESTTVTPVKSTSYYLSVRGTVCDEVYSLPAIVDVEQKIDFELTTDVNGIICEGKEANISLNLISGRPSNVIFTANDVADPYNIVKKNTYKVKPEESTTYSLSLAGTACNTAVIKTVDVKIQKQPKLSVSIDKTAVCEGDDVTITPTSDNVDDLEWKYSVDGITYTDLIKATTAQVLNPSQSIMYMIKTMADDACESVEWTQKVEVEPVFTVSLDVNSSVVCPGAEVEVNANVEGMSDKLKFEWKMKGNGTNFHAVSPTADPTIFKTNLDATTDFSLTVSGKYCEPQTVTTTATVDEVPTLILEASKDSLCEGDEVILSTKFSSDNFDESSILIQNEENDLASGLQVAMLTPDESMSIVATASTPAGCVIKPASKEIFVDKLISLDVPNDTILCEGGVVKLSINGNKGYQYLWSVNDELISKTSKFEYDGEESVIVKLDVLSKICKESYDININVVPTPRIISVEESGSNAFEIVAEGGSGKYMFDYGNGYQESSTLSPATYGKTYNIKVKDELGCGSDTTIKTPTYELEIPIHFTPNGDGIDDVWEIKNLDKYPSASVRLYDRFGKQLYDMTAEEMNAWDGTYNGHALPATDYWYEIQIDEVDKVYTGHFTLIRK